MLLLLSALTAATVPRISPSLGALTVPLSYTTVRTSSDGKSTLLSAQLEQNATVEAVLETQRKICITGKLDMTRNQLAEILEDKGFKVAGTVTKDCYALITAGDTSSSKYKRAATLGVAIIDYWSSKKDVLSGDF